MDEWIITGTKDGQRRKWKLSAASESDVRRAAESKGVKDIHVERAAPVLAPIVQQEIQRPVSQVIAVPSTVQCDNCGKSIGRLETPRQWQDAMVCAECFGRLSPAVFQQAPAPTPAAPQVVMMQAPSPAMAVNVHNTNIVGAQRRGCLGTILHFFYSMFLLIVLAAIILILLAVYMGGGFKHLK